MAESTHIFYTGNKPSQVKQLVTYPDQAVHSLTRSYLVRLCTATYNSYGMLKKNRKIKRLPFGS